MNNAVVIIDFDNYFQKDINEYSKEQIESLFLKIIDYISIHNDVMQINFRLYGGWYQDDDLTNRASVVFQKISNIDIFPHIINQNKRIFGDIQIVYNLYGIDYIWHNTYIEKKGIPRLRINHTAKGDKCDSRKNICPVHILSKFTRNKDKICLNEGCMTKHSDIFFQREQKMVDTMIACDLLSYCEESSTNCLYLISDDMDHFPALALCHKKKEELPIFVGIKNVQNIVNYSSILENFNIKIFQLS